MPFASSPTVARPMTPAGIPAVSDPPPTPPEPPLASDCCGGGCARCVHDLYDEALEKFAAELAAWQARQCAQGEQR